MGNFPPYSTWVNVDLDAIRGNVRYVKDHTGSEVMAIVKANAYGHGAVPVAKAALQGGASWCGVARPDEAHQLRQGGVESPILILGFIRPERIQEMIRNEVSLTVWTEAHIRETARQAQDINHTAQLHLKVDSGMGRLGCFPEEAGRLAHLIQQASNLELEGIFSHLARADETDPHPTDRQHEAFSRALSHVAEKEINPPFVHLANSAASLTRPGTHFNLVRLGISLYGLPPSPAVPLPDPFQRALSWKSVLAAVRTLPPDHGVSYGHEYVTQTQETIGVLPLGYADGFRRLAGNEVLIHGQKCPVVGRVCMDQTMVQIDGIHDPRVGDEVVLIGKQGEEEITADMVGRRWGTINYEVTCGIGPRVPRLYENQSG